MASIDITIPVPAERLGEFYTLVGAWLNGEHTVGTSRRESKRASSRPRRSRYAPLYVYLSESVEPDTKELEFPFEQIERIIEAQLPRSAYTHRAWWANTPTHAQANAWVSAGWRVDAIDFDRDTVTFIRSEEA
jgi:hypothetical protein